MAKDAFLMYVDDWLSSGRIELMDAHEERGYLRLLLRAWKQSDCGLPTDELTLAAWSKMGTQWFRETADRTLRQAGMTSGQKVLACFVERKSRLFNIRQLEEFNYQQDYLARQKINGKRGGRPKKEPTDNPLVIPQKPTGYENDNPLDNPGVTQKNQPEPETKTTTEAPPSEAKKPSPENGSATAHGSRFTLQVLPKEYAEYCRKSFGWDESRIETVFEDFRLFWIAKAGRDGRKADWLATWQGWCRRENQKRRTPTLPFSSRESATERAIRVGHERIAATGRL